MAYNKRHFCFDFIIMPTIAVLIVLVLNNEINFDFTETIYENNWIIIDSWFFIHILMTSLIAMYYPYNLSIRKFWLIIIVWEILENIILPNTFAIFGGFKENIKDTFGDILAPIPATYLLYKHR